MRSASSTAYSSISFMTTSTEARSRVLSLSESLRSAQVSGTCLTSTTMFTWGADLRESGASGQDRRIGCAGRVGPAGGLPSRG